MQASTETYKHTNPALFYGGAAVVDYYGADNDNYVAGEGFCCGDNNLKTKSISDDSPNYEKLQYYYHSDHLGSASYITNLDGEVVQHIEYVPFGEVFLEERNNTWNTPFLFNGKELDEETGLYYYGARYYNPRISLWYGVDPLAEKYPTHSPYCYTMNNPIMLVDPDGRDIWEVNGDGRIVKHIKDESQDTFYMVGKNADGNYQRTYTTDYQGNKHYNSISFKGGTITSSKKGDPSIERDPTEYSVTDESSGAELFKFFADNIKKEFGLINTLSDGSLVMTNHLLSGVAATASAKKLDSEGQAVTSIVHNHPRNTDPSGFNSGNTRGDKFRVSSLPTSQGVYVPRFVYKSQNSQLVLYDSNAIMGSYPWNSIFQPSNSRIQSFHQSYPGEGLLPY